VDFVLFAIIAFMASFVGTALSIKTFSSTTKDRYKPLPKGAYIIPAGLTKKETKEHSEQDDSNPITEEIKHLEEWFAKKVVSDDEE